MNRRTAILFCMGRELLEGIVLDRNANFMASHLTEAGFRVRTIQVLDDIEAEAVASMQRAMELEPTLILITGGMGPGIDDITRECVAKAADVPLVLDAKAKEFLDASYKRLVARGVVRDSELTDERLKMATVPEGSECFENPIGTAPAVKFKAGGTTFFCLPGQPEELRRLFQACVTPVLEDLGPRGHRASAHIDYPGGDESMITRMLGDLKRRHSTIDTRARLHGADGDLRMRITLTAEGADRDTVESALQAATADLRARLGLEVSNMPGGHAAE